MCCFQNEILDAQASLGCTAILGQFSGTTLSLQLAVTQQPGECLAVGAQSSSFTPPSWENHYLSFLGILIIFTITEIVCEGDREDVMTSHDIPEKCCKRIKYCWLLSFCFGFTLTKPIPRRFLQMWIILELQENFSCYFYYSWSVVSYLYMILHSFKDLSWISNVKPNVTHSANSAQLTGKSPI